MFSRIEAENMGETESEDSGRRKSMCSRRPSKAPKLEQKSETRETDEMGNVDADDFLERPLIETLMR